MATVLIVSKTKMGNTVCVGGIHEEFGELIRLHNERGGNLSPDVPYEIGDRWEMSVSDAWNARKAPHLEDKITIAIRKLENVGIKGVIDYINTHNLQNRLYSGSLHDTFDGCLQSRTYVTKDRVPQFSTQFWKTDADLIHSFQYDKHSYYYKGIRIKYVGFQEPVDKIPAGTIIRLSLAHWYDGKGDWPEQRCYLQLSGWYID